MAPTGMNEVAFTASNNLSSTYKIMAPADAASKVYGLHIHLHGDGGGGYQDFPNVETRFDLVGVTILSPNNGQSWNRDGQNFSQFLHELIQDDLLAKYDIDLSKIYFSSVSGGSYFLTGAFVPLYGQFYKDGGAFMMCGGRAPQFDFAVPDTIKEFRLHWQSTLEVDRADIASSIDDSIAAYKVLLDAEQGDPLVQSSVVEGAFGHCEFDGVAYTSGIQFMIDTNFSAILPAVAQ
ncbi:MAG: hypothetical protein AB8G05_15085 [Oligoflexales bacterium]